MSLLVEPPAIRELIERAEPERRLLASRLARLRARIRRHLAIEGSAKVAALVVALAAVSLVADRWLRLETSSRVVLAFGGLAAVLMAAWRWLVQPMLLPLGDLDLAELVDRRRRGVGQRIVDVLQLPDLFDTPQFASPSLVSAAVRDCAQQLEEVDFASLLDERRFRRNQIILGSLVAVPLVFAAIWPHTAGIWARRWFLAGDVRWPQATYLALEGLGDRDRLLTPRGEGLVLQLNALPQFAHTAQGWRLDGRGEPLVVETDDPPDREIPEKVSLTYWTPTGRSKQALFTRFEGANFRYELPPLVEPIDVTIAGGDDWFGPVRIEPIDRPAVAQLKLVARPPGASQDEIHDVGKADEPLVFLPETKLELQLAASEPLATAEVLSKDEKPKSLEPAGDANFSLKWTMSETETLELRLVSAASGLVSKPYFLTIGLLIDREPRLTLRSSGVSKNITPQARVPLAIHAADDFGLTHLTLELEKTSLVDEKQETTVKPIELEKFGADGAVLPPSLDRDLEFKIADQQLAAGNSIRIRATAGDQCALGAHTGSSRWLPFQIVTPEQLFYEILMRQREQRARFAAAVTQAQGQADALAALDSLDGLRPLSRTHQAIGRSVSQIASRLDTTLREMTLNELANPVARQLLADTVITPLRELGSGPMENLRGQLDRLAAGESIDPAGRDAALATQQEIVKTMQKILEQMAQWESFVDVVNQLRHIIEEQTSLKQGTEAAQKKQTDELFDE